MATNRTFVVHEFEGGWSTELGQTLRVGVGEDRKLRLTHLVNAENIVYEADGGPHKMPGTTRLNTIPLANVTAIDNQNSAYLTRGANLTGAADDPIGIFSARVKFKNTPPTGFLVQNDTATLVFRADFATQRFRVELFNSIFSSGLVFTSTTGLLENTFYNILVRWDINAAGGARTAEMWLNDTKETVKIGRAHV